MQAKGSDILTEASYSRLSRVLSTGSLFTLVASFVAAATSAYGVTVSLTATVASVILLLIGYGLQLLLFKATRHRRPDEQKSYESTVRYFVFAKALPVVALALVCGAATSITCTDAFVPGSLFPLMLGALVALPIIIGAVVCFYPNHRLVSMKTLITSVPLFCIVFFITAGSRGAYVVSSVCLALHALCTLVTLNQTNMTKTYIGTITSVASTRDKLYNVRLVAIALLLTLLGAVLVYTVLNGVRTMFLMVLALFLFRNHGDASDTTAPTQSREELDAAISRFLYGESTPSHSVNFYFFIVFVILALTLLILLAVTWLRSGRSIVQTVRAIISRIIEFFSNLFSRGPKFESEARIISSYVDSEQRLSYDNRKRENTTDDLRAFMRRLESIRDSRGRLEFSYATFVSLLNRVPVNIKRSDTPRQIRKRLAASTPVLTQEDVDAVTRCYESVAYSAEPASDAECQAATSTLVAAIRRILG